MRQHEETDPRMRSMKGASVSVKPKHSWLYKTQKGFAAANGLLLPMPSLS